MAKMTEEEKQRRKADREAARTAEQDAYIKRLVAEAPPLTSEQRAKLASLLRPHR
jgi:hypothetical protein